MKGRARGYTQEVLTNEAVISMVNAGLPDSIILVKIRSSQTKFDTRTQSLIALKQSGVPEKVIEAMVIADSPSSTTAPASSSPPPAPAVRSGPPSVSGVPLAETLAIASLPVIEAARGRGSVYHLVDAKYVELTPNVGELQSNFAFFQQKSELVLQRRRAHYRVTDRQPVFYSPYSVSELQLVRLKPGDDHDDRNLKISSGAAMPYFGVTQRRGIRAEDRVQVSAEKDQRGWYRITPRTPLGVGEYGLALTHGFAAGATTGQIYDFGVD